jgi:hypothetical protein
MDLYLPDACVDTVICSPPYFGLRSYQDGGEHYEGQVGDEATPAEYLDALIACTAEWMRVLKPSGSIFVNLGDKYVADNRGSGGDAKRGEAKWAPAGPAGYPGEGIMPRKSLMLLPQRYAIRCIDELGLILRAEIVWAKPNGLPESVTDRVRRSHEQVFHFVKQPRYYSAVDEVREQSTTAPRYEQRATGRAVPGLPVQSNLGAGGSHLTAANYNPLGKLPGSVWEIPTAPLKVPDHLGIDHFAAYPPELVRRIVLGWSPREVCTACGEGRRPVTVAEYDTQGRTTNGPKNEARRALDAANNPLLAVSSGIRAVRQTTITGYACACPDTDAPATRGVVLDPFGGTGTAALVASCYGRVGISVDLSADYCRLAQWRTTDPGERARVLGVDKPPVQVNGQLGMFEGLGA